MNRVDSEGPSLSEIRAGVPASVTATRAVARNAARTAARTASKAAILATTEQAIAARSLAGGTQTGARPSSPRQSAAFRAASAWGTEPPQR